jgi:hypothetical protein
MDQMLPSAIFNAIVRERQFQDQKYGPVNRGGGHDLTGWLIVLQKELAEAMEAATGHGKKSRTGRNTVRAEILQIAAVAVAALEQHGLDTLADGFPPSAPEPAWCQNKGKCVYAACDCYERTHP